MRQAEDTHVARLYRSAPTLGATLIEAMFPRAYIDANRSLDDIDPAMLADAWPRAARGVAQDRSRASASSGASRAAARRCTTRKLTAAEVQRRIERWYRPYHAALAAEIDARHRDVRRRVAHQLPFDAGGRRRERRRSPAARAPTSCSAIATARPASRRSPRSSRKRVAALGYTVAINDPYKGVEIVRKHGRPRERRHSLQIELNRRLYMDEATLVPNAGYPKLEADLERLLDRALRDYVRAHV